MTKRERLTERANVLRVNAYTDGWRAGWVARGDAERAIADARLSVRTEAFERAVQAVDDHDNSG